MSQDLSRPKPPDESRVQLTVGWEVTHWTRELGASEEELQQVIRRVGPEVAAVRQFLAKSGSETTLPISLH